MRGSVVAGGNWTRKSETQSASFSVSVQSIMPDPMMPNSGSEIGCVSMHFNAWSHRFVRLGCLGNTLVRFTHKDVIQIMRKVTPHLVKYFWCWRNVVERHDKTDLSKRKCQALG